MSVFQGLCGSFGVCSHLYKVRGSSDLIKLAELYEHDENKHIERYLMTEIAIVNYIQNSIVHISNDEKRNR